MASSSTEEKEMSLLPKYRRIIPLTEGILLSVAAFTICIILSLALSEVAAFTKWERLGCSFACSFIIGMLIGKMWSLYSLETWVMKLHNSISTMAKLDDKPQPLTKH